MAYPYTLDSFTNPLANQKLQNPSHSAIETAQNTALTAIQANLGVTGSTVPTTIDFLLKSVSSTDPGHKHTYGAMLGTIPVSAFGTIPASAITGGINSTSITSVNASSIIGTFSSTSVSVSSSTILGIINQANLVAPSSKQATRAYNAGTGTQNIAHGLPVIPRMVKISAFQVGSSGSTAANNLCIGTAIITSGGSISAQHCTDYNYRGSTPEKAATDASNIIVIVEGNSGTIVTQAAVSAADATNITLNFTTMNAGGGSSTYDLLMEIDFFP